MILFLGVLFLLFVFLACFCLASTLALLVWGYFKFSRKTFNFGTLDNKYIPKKIEFPIIAEDEHMIHILHAHLPKLKKSLTDNGCNGDLDELYLKTKFGPKIPLRYLTQCNDYSGTHQTFEFLLKKTQVLEQFNKLKRSEVTSNPKEFMKEFEQNGYIIIQNDKDSWSNLYSSFFKNLTELFEKGDPGLVSQKAHWEYLKKNKLNMEVIEGKKMNAPTNPSSIEEISIESSMILYDHLETISHEISEVIAEQLGYSKDYFTSIKQYDNIIRMLKLKEPSRKQYFVKTQADLGILSICPKGTKSSLVVLNQTSLDWEKVEDKMKDDDVLIYPGYLMSYMTDGKIKPLLYSYDSNPQEVRYTSNFQLAPDSSFKFKNSNGEYEVKDINEEINENRNRFFFETNLEQYKEFFFGKNTTPSKKKDDV